MTVYSDVILDYPLYLTYFYFEQIYLYEIDIINVINYDLNNWFKKIVFTTVCKHGVNGKEKNAVKTVNSTYIRCSCLNPPCWTRF